MKPRFSILTLLGITAYVAVQVASVAQPESYWSPAAFYLHAAFMFLLAVIACGRTSPATVFTRAMLTGYFIYSYLNSEELFYYDTDYEQKLFVFNWWLYFNEGASIATDSFVDRCNCVALGLTLGCIALWRYRIVERREKKQTHAND